MTYVDTSTLLKLLIDEEGSARAERIWLEVGGRSAAMTVIAEARAERPVGSQASDRLGWRPST